MEEDPCKFFDLANALLPFMFHDLRERILASHISHTSFISTGILWKCRFWAHENGRVEMLRLLKKYGVSETVRDAEGKTPLDFSRKR